MKLKIIEEAHRNIDEVQIAEVVEEYEITYVPVFFAKIIKFIIWKIIVLNYFLPYMNGKSRTNTYN